MRGDKESRGPWWLARDRQIFVGDPSKNRRRLSAPRRLGGIRNVNERRPGVRQDVGECRLGVRRDVDERHLGICWGVGERRLGVRRDVGEPWV